MLSYSIDVVDPLTGNMRELHLKETTADDDVATSRNGLEGRMIQRLFANLDYVASCVEFSWLENRA